MTENLERHQEKLEEKQAACLEQIRDMEKQVTAGTTTLAHLQGAAGQEVGEEPPASSQRARALVPSLGS